MKGDLVLPFLLVLNLDILVIPTLHTLTTHLSWECLVISSNPWQYWIMVGCAMHMEGSFIQSKSYIDLQFSLVVRCQNWMMLAPTLILVHGRSLPWARITSCVHETTISPTAVKKERSLSCSRTYPLTALGGMVERSV